MTKLLLWPVVVSVPRRAVASPGPLLSQLRNAVASRVRSAVAPDVGNAASRAASLPGLPEVLLVTILSFVEGRAAATVAGCSVRLHQKVAYSPVLWRLLCRRELPDPRRDALCDDLRKQDWRAEFEGRRGRRTIAASQGREGRRGDNGLHIAMRRRLQWTPLVLRPDRWAIESMFFD